MKKDYSDIDSNVVIHVCRDIEYKGGVEAVLFDFMIYEDTYTHIMICTEGAPGNRTKRLLKKGKCIYYVTGSFFKKVLTIQKIVSQYNRPLLHCHLYRPEVIGACIFGCKRKITTKYCTYASDSQVGSGIMGIIKRYIDNNICDYIVTALYDDIIVITDELITKWRLFKSRLHFVPISTIRQYASPRKNKILNNEMVLIAAARMVKEKQHDLLIQALGHVKYSKLHLLGDGPLRSEIEKSLYDNGIRNVEIHGSVSRKEVLDYMDKSDIFLLTSKTEGFPLLIQEAMSRGLPVVAMDAGATRTLINDKTGALVTTNSAKAFAHKINSLKGKDIEIMSDAAIKMCKQKCNFYKTCDMIIEIYQRKVVFK